MLALGKKYKDLLKLAKDKVDELKIPFKTKKAQKNLELKIIEIESEIADHENNIQKVFTENDEINWDTVIDAINKKDLAERKLGQLEALKEELFD
jgi:hypothetical protein